MVVLGVEELGRSLDLGGDLPVALCIQSSLEGVARGDRRLGLAFAVRIQRRSVLGARVVPLPHALGRVVALPEHLEECLEGDDLRVEHHQHRLGVVGAAAAGFLVGRIGRVSARVTDSRRPDARGLPEHALRAPETAQAELHLLESFGERRRHRVALGQVLRRHAHLVIAPRQGAFGGEQLGGLLHESEHGDLLIPYTLEYRTSKREPT